ncbi:hypothetical protein AB0A66_34215 [Streptomyces longwoodensis]
MLQTQADLERDLSSALPPRPRDTTALRRRLLLLSVRLSWHPYWETVPSVPAARSDLRHLARHRIVALNGRPAAADHAP